jgi:hypothetical protein
MIALLDVSHRLEVSRAATSSIAKKCANPRVATETANTDRPDVRMASLLASPFTLNRPTPECNRKLQLIATRKEL